MFFEINERSRTEQKSSARFTFTSILIIIFVFKIIKNRYAKYEDEIKNAERLGPVASMTMKSMGVGMVDSDDELPQSTTSLTRTRVENFQSEEQQPQNHADLIKMHFRDPNMNCRFPEFKLDEKYVQFYNCGGLSENQHYMDCKSQFADGATATEIEGGRQEYRSRLAEGHMYNTTAAVICEKGRKKGLDMFPNQDNYFISFHKTCSVYGVFDGHGPWGHLVSGRLVQSFPHFLFSHPEMQKIYAERQNVDAEMLEPVQNDRVEGIINDVFESTHQDLKAWAKGDASLADDDWGRHKIDCSVSGSTGSVLIQIGCDVYIATIGDSKIVLAQWTRLKDNSGIDRILAESEEHKPSLPAEMEMITASGEYEVRDERVYLKGKGIPGVAMSRCFGDFLCTALSHTPTIKRQTMTGVNSSDWCAFIASDGIWEFMNSKVVVDSLGANEGKNYGILKKYDFTK